MENLSTYQIHQHIEILTNWLGELSPSIYRDRVEEFAAEIKALQLEIARRKEHWRL